MSDLIGKQFSPPSSVVSLCSQASRQAGRQAHVHTPLLGSSLFLLSFTSLIHPSIQPSIHARRARATMPAPARLRSLYRSLLRELPPRPLLSSPPSHLHGRLRTSFAADPASPGSTGHHHHHQHHLAEQLVAYLRSQRLYVTLIERYNPGMGMDEEERVRLTARRVGMDMPSLYRNRTGESK